MQTRITLQTGSILQEITLTFCKGKLSSLSFGQPNTTPQSNARAHVHTLWKTQLLEYLSGHRRAFDLPTHLTGTPFQLRVWQELRAIPYGHTTTYAAIARAIGSPNAWRAVGTAVGKNPIPIVIPCHRVLPSTGGIGQYSAGQKRKQYLLKIEGFAKYKREGVY